MAKMLDADVFVRGVLDKLTKIAESNNYRQVLISTTDATLSNRDNIRGVMKRLIKDKPLVRQSVQPAFPGNTSYSIAELSVWKEIPGTASSPLVKPEAASLSAANQAESSSPVEGGEDGSWEAVGLAKELSVFRRWMGKNREDAVREGRVFDPSFDVRDFLKLLRFIEGRGYFRFTHESRIDLFIYIAGGAGRDIFETVIERLVVLNYIFAVSARKFEKGLLHLPAIFPRERVDLIYAAGASDRGVFFELDETTGYPRISFNLPWWLGRPSSEIKQYIRVEAAHFLAVNFLLNKERYLQTPEFSISGYPRAFREDILQMLYVAAKSKIMFELLGRREYLEILLRDMAQSASLYRQGETAAHLFTYLSVLEAVLALEHQKTRDT
ncbi:MAG: hypothetical protein AAB356_01090, partial [Deltaproteobacteria bacterium]